MFTKETLLEVCPNASRSKLDLDQLSWQLGIALNSLIADSDFGLNSIYRQAAFLAQTGHESANFQAVSENLNYSQRALLSVFKKYFPTEDLAAAYARQPEKIANRVYGNRMGNGPEESGDGWKFRGRGLIQLTGKNNYEACASELYINLIEEPEWLETPQGAVQSALWYWNKNDLNSYADREDLRGMTRVINGGYHGFADRIARYEKAKRILSQKWQNR